MHDLFDAHDALDIDDPPFRPSTPLPDPSRTLRRTISCVSIDTIRPSPNKGIRRSIDEIARGLTEKKKKKRDGPKKVTVPENAACEPKTPSKSGPEKRARKTKSPLRDASHTSTEANSSPATTDRLHGGIFEPDCEPLMLLLGWQPKFGTDDLLFGDDDDNVCMDGLFSPNLRSGGRLFQLPKIATIDDIQLAIEPPKQDVTFWDGLDAKNLVFKCRLHLRCTTHAFDTVMIPDITRVEMDCLTRPPNLHHPKSPVLQAAYLGAVSLIATTKDGQPDVSLDAGIQMDRTWCKALNLDRTWGWYKDVFVPLSPRLFDKMEYREFKLVSKVWVRDNFVEGQLIFGISMLLRGVDMPK